MDSIKTPRLLLRQWTEDDFEPFAQMNFDPKIREFLPVKVQRDRENSYTFAKDIIKRNEEKNWGSGYAMWAVEIPGQAKFIGRIMLVSVPFEAHFTPAVEIGWYISPVYWGKGYATEAAQAVLRYAFETLNLPEIVAYTVVNNIRSRRVMEKLGMDHNPNEDFDHPNLDKDDSFCRHVLYQISKNKFKNS